MTLVTLTIIFQKKLGKHSKTAIKYSYLCNVKIKMRGGVLAREKNLPRALRNSATRDRKSDIGMATMRELINYLTNKLFKNYFELWLLK